MVNSCPTLRVDIRVWISAGVYAEQRLRADAAEIYAVDVRHHAGHYGLVKQRRPGYLETMLKIFVR